VDFHVTKISHCDKDIYNIYSSMHRKCSTLIWYVLCLLVKVTEKMSMFNKTPHHEDVKGSGRTALHILSLSMIWSLGLTSHPSHTTPRERVPQPNGQECGWAPQPVRHTDKEKNQCFYCG